MDTIFQLDNELMVELSEDAQELVQGGNIFYDLSQDFDSETFALAAVNGPGGSGVVVAAEKIASSQTISLDIL